LQIAVHAYRHPTTEHQISVVGTAHIGDDHYYRQVAEFVSAREAEGAVVHYERVRKGAGEQMADFTGPERHVLDIFRALATGQRRLGMFLGLTHQFARLTPRDEWLNADMTDLELIRALGVDGAPRRVPPVDELFDELERAPWWFAAGFRTLVRALLRLATWSAPRLRWRNRWPDSRIVVDARNQLAVQAALSAPQDRPLVMIWGAAHLPGIGALLAASGYARTETRWFTVLGGPQRRVRQIAEQPGLNLSG